MRKNTSHQSAAAVLFIVSTISILIAGWAFPSAETAMGLTQPAVACPPQTQPKGGQCVLGGDVKLVKSLRLVSNTKLNCQGHKLLPQHTGSDLSNRSNPEVAIFLNGVQNVQIQNCVIDGFDFGIFAIKSKIPDAIKNNPGELAQRRNKILQNTINARFLAISLASVDNTEIKDNTIRYTTAGGKGIYVGRDSDLNRINNNTITGDIASAASQAVGAPGPAIPSPNPTQPSSNPVVPVGQAVLITQTLGPDPTLLNAIIEGELFQLPVVNSPTPNESFSQDNIFEGNTIVFTQTPFDAVVISIAQKTTVRNNIIRAASASIRTGIQSGPEGLSKNFPGECTNPAGRLCLVNTDCNILGTTGSTCSSPPPVPVFWVSDGALIEGNTITGPFNSGIATNGTKAIIRGNTITGPNRPTSNAGAINLVMKFGLGDTTIVTRNVVSDVRIALMLINSLIPGLEAKDFRARVSLNDFTGYTTSVRSDIAATLSVAGQGNFWGLPCPLGFDPTKVLSLPATAVVTDDHPFGTPVARNTGTLPRPCR